MGSPGHRRQPQIHLQRTQGGLPLGARAGHGTGDRVTVRCIYRVQHNHVWQPAASALFWRVVIISPYHGSVGEIAGEHGKLAALPNGSP